MQINGWAFCSLAQKKQTSQCTSACPTLKGVCFCSYGNLFVSIKSLFAQVVCGALQAQKKKHQILLDWGKFPDVTLWEYIVCCIPMGVKWHSGHDVHLCPLQQLSLFT